MPMGVDNIIIITSLRPTTQSPDPTHTHKPLIYKTVNKVSFWLLNKRNISFYGCVKDLRKYL